MRKRIANVCVIAILVYGIFSCTQTTGDTFVAETENMEAGHTETADTESSMNT